MASVQIDQNDGEMFGQARIARVPKGSNLLTAGKQVSDLIFAVVLALEDIPVRLAQYGLMEPNAFVDEMLECMELAKADK